jgi:hypothetical protein
MTTCWIYRHVTYDEEEETSEMFTISYLDSDLNAENDNSYMMDDKVIWSLFLHEKHG